MRKAIIIFAGVLLFTTGAVIAEKMQQGTEAVAANEPGAMDRPAMMGPGMAMAWMMMPRVVSTQSDGSIIVQTGSKLIKYDRDLTMKKEVMVPIDSETVMMMMHDMKHRMPPAAK